MGRGDREGNREEAARTARAARRGPRVRESGSEFASFGAGDPGIGAGSPTSPADEVLGATSTGSLVDDTLDLPLFDSVGGEDGARSGKFTRGE